MEVVLNRVIGVKPWMPLFYHIARLYAPHKVRMSPKPVAVLRAELGDVARFSRTDQAVAYAGLDVEIKESGLWKGKAKLSKRGSGLLRRVLSLAAIRSLHTEGSAFGASYRRLVARGLRKGPALIAVMRKMLAVAVPLLKHEEDYDPGKVCASSAASSAGR